MGFHGTFGAVSQKIDRKSVDFDGGTELINRGADTDLSFGDTWSISMWFDPDTVTTQETILMFPSHDRVREGS